jgi:hypothetical protein
MKLSSSHLATLLLTSVATLSSACATLQGISHAAGTDRQIQLQNALSIPLCGVDAVVAGTPKEMGLSRTVGAMPDPVSRIEPGGTVFVQLPDFDRKANATYGLRARACENGNSVVATTIADLPSSEISHHVGAGSEPIILR